MNSIQTYTPTQTYRPTEEPVFGVEWNPTGTNVLLSCGDSSCKILDSSSGQISKSIIGEQYEYHVPFTAGVWRPKRSAALVKNVFIGINSGGEVVHGHLQKENTTKIIHKGIIDCPSLCSVDYSLDGAIYAVGCGDNSLRIFDETTKTEQSRLDPGPSTAATAARVVCTKFIGPHLIASGGWAKNILIWDLRINQVAQTFTGCHMRGDCIDFKDDRIMAGNYHNEKQIITYSLRTGTEMQSMTVEEVPPVLVLAAQYSKNDRGRRFAFGGSGTNKLFVHDSESFELIGETSDLPSPVFCLDWASNSNSCVVGLGNGQVHVYDF